MAMFSKSDSRESAITVFRLDTDGRGFNDLVFRVGLATRKDYMVSHGGLLAI